MKITPFLDRVGSEIDVFNQRFIENHVFAIIKLAVFQIETNLNGVQYKTTKEIRRLEYNIDLIVKAILSGQAELNELRAACAAWVEAAKPAPGEI